MTDELGRLAKLGWVAPEAGADGVRHLVSTDGSAISYPEDGFDVLGLEGGSGFWFEHRAAAVGRHVNGLGISSMWEVGAGTGAMASRLRSQLTEVITVEPLVAGAQTCAALGLTSLRSTLQDLGLPDQSLESVGIFDVLEHLKHPVVIDDRAFRSATGFAHRIDELTAVDAYRRAFPVQ